MTKKEIFWLGYAYGCFALGDCGAAIHAVLPGTLEDGTEENEVFAPLFEEFNKIDENLEDSVEVRKFYLNAILAFAAKHDLDLGFNKLD